MIAEGPKLDMDGVQPNPFSRFASVLLALAVFVGLASVVHFAVETERDRLEQIERTRVQQRLATMVRRIDAELNANVFLANGLVAYVSAMGDRYQDRMEAAMEAVYQFGRHLRNIGVAPDNRIQHIYPIEGNEAALGLYYPDLVEQWPAVKEAIDAGTTVLAGPVKLKQGGSGLISRTPVILPDGSYWGILSLVMDMESFLSEIGLAAEVNGVRFAVRGKDGVGEKGEVFLGDVDLFEIDSVRQSMNVPGGVWIAAAYPVNGWRSSQDHLVYVEVAGLVLSLVMAAGVFGYQRNRAQAVESAKRLRIFLDTTREGVIVIDQAGTIQEFNAAAEDLFGYTTEEVVGMSVNRLMPAQDAAQHNAYLRNASNKAFHLMAGERRVMGRRKDGVQFPIEVSVGMATVRNRRFHVGLVRDITERQAFENRLIELATTDSLTGLLNRRAFLESAETAFKLARRHRHPLSAMMIDADHFKRINDSFGHQVGDDVLVELTTICRDFFRTTDTLARFGGEEFIILLPETDIDRAEEVARRLLEKIRAAEVATDGGETVRFTVSIGVAAMSDEDAGIEDLIKRADAALYDAKKEGRDRHVVAR